MATTPTFNPAGDGSVVNPNATSLENFINDANAAGNGAIDPSIVATIGHNLGNTNQGKLALAVTKQGLAIPNKTSQFLYEPTAVNPTQTTKKVVQDHFSNTGITPWNTKKIAQMQQTLMNAKLNGQSGLYTPPNAKADGVWNADWANAAYQYQQDQANLPGLGNTGARNVFDTAFSTSFWSHAIPLVESVIKAIPGDALKGLGDGLKLATDGFTALQNFMTYGDHSDTKATGYQMANWLSNVGNKIEGQKQLTDAEYAKQSNWEALMHIGNLALTLSTIGKLGESAVVAGKGAIAAGEEAGASNAAKALFTRVDPIAPKGPLNWIMNSAMPEVEGGGNRFAFTNWFKNSPSAARIAPNLTARVSAGLDQTASDIQSAYKVARRVAATPYQLPVLGLAGQIGSDVSVAGMKLGLQGHLDNWMGDPNAPVAYELNHLHPIAGRFGLALNLLQMVGHGTEYTDATLPSDAVGNAISGIVQTLADGLNKTGATSEWERGAQTAYTDVANKLIAKNLPVQLLDAHIWEQLNKSAAEHAAQSLVDEAKLRGEIPPANHDAEFLFQRNAASVILNDPAKLANARESYLAKPMQFAKDVANSLLTHKENPTSIYSNDLVSKLENDYHYKNQVLPHLANITTPETQLQTEILARLSRGETVEPWEYPGNTLAEAKTAALGDKSFIAKHGFMKVERQTAGDAQATALSFAKDLEKAKPGYKAPTTVDGLTEASDGSEFGALSRPYQMPATFDKATATSEEMDVRHKVLNYLGSELGRNVRDLQYVPTQDLIKLIAEKSFYLAADATIGSDAPKELIDAVAKMRESGYKPVYGTDLGHRFTDAPIDLKQLGIEQNMTSRLLDKAGINFSAVDEHTASAGTAIAAKNALQDEISAKLAEDPMKLGTASPWATGNHLMEFLHDVIKPKSAGMARFSVGATASKLGKPLTLRGLYGGVWDKEIADLVGTTQKRLDGSTVAIKDEHEALTYLKSRLTADTSPQAWTRKDFINALTYKGDANGMIDTKYEGMAGEMRQTQAIGMNEKDASDLWYAMQKGLRNGPTYTGGINPISKLLNSTFGLANVPLQVNGKRLLDLTGDVQGALIKNRYLYSPRQAYLRVVKSAIKGVNENMPFSMNADASLKELGAEAEQKAYDLTDKVFGVDKNFNEVKDFTTKEFDSKDYFNIYNPRAVLARTVHYVAQNMAEEGKSIETAAGEAELKKRVDAINNYGSRTAAEKTLNGFFFPFSFEKTVIRELGSHLLDNPSSRLMTAAAISLYNSADGQKMKTWMEDNLPLFKEAEKFNPFYHGIGLGQFGGINRVPEGIVGRALYGGKTLPNLEGVSDADRLKLFVQMLTPKPLTGIGSAQAMANLIPAVKDLNNIFVGYDLNGKKPFGFSNGTSGGEVWASAKDLYGLANRALHTQFDQQPASVFASQGYQPYDLQQKNAWNTRAKYIAWLAPALVPGANFKFNADTPYVGGLKVNRANINKLVARIYPDWDPNLAKYAQARDVATTIERGRIQADVKAKSDPTLVLRYDAFTQGSDKIQAEIQKDFNSPNFDPKTIAVQMEQLRQLAGYLAAADNNFPNFYAKYYASKYGPLKGL